MSKLAVRSVAAAFATALVLSTAAPAFANPPPPTNGGNGAGSSGQCHATEYRTGTVTSLDGSSPNPAEKALTHTCRH